MSAGRPTEEGLTAWKLKVPEPLRDRIAEVIRREGEDGWSTAWEQHRLKLADAIIKELGL